MLLRFSVSNHLSIRGSQELLFTTSSLKDETVGLIDCALAPRGSVLPAVVVFGANASGKSNFVHALRAMQQMVLFSQTRGSPSGGVPRYPFRLDRSFPEKPTRFEIDFVREGVRYHYGFETNDAAFLSEWLYAIPKSHRRTLFEREGSNFRFGRELKGRNNVIAGLTRPNSLFLSAAAQNSHEQLTMIFDYFKTLECLMSIEPSSGFWLGDEAVDPRVIDFLGNIDTGICDYRRKETEPEEESRVALLEVSSAMRKLINAPVDWNDTGKQAPLEFAHQSRDGEQIYLDPGMESAGTQRLLVILTLAFRALDEGALLVVDELDVSLHTLASASVLKLFCSPETNPRGAQLVATTHDINLMRWAGLRRDQLWFTEKDSAGATLLYPLSDIRTRRSDDIAKGYLQGRYGAVPFADPISALGTE